jgi:hypothetical protein
MTVNENYFVNEGNRIGGQEPQALGSVQSLVTASVAVTKGMVIESTGDFTVGPAGDNSAKVVGIAANTAAIGEKVVIETEGFVKLSASNAVIAAGDSVVAAGDGLVKKMPVLANDLASIQAVSNKCGIAIAGCLANGNPYVKFSV